MAADLAAKAGLVSAPSSPTTNATAVSGGPAAAPLTSPALPAFNFGGAASPSGSSAFNFGGSVPAAAAPAPAAPGFQFNFDSSTAAAPAAAPVFNFAAPVAAGADAPKFQFNFTPSAAGDDDDEDDDEDDEESDEDFDFDEMDFDGLMGDDDKWLFTAEDVDVDDIREGFGLDDTAVVVKLNANKTSSLDEVTKVLQQQARKCLKQTNSTRDAAALAEGSGPEHSVSVVRALVGESGLAVVFKTLNAKKKLAVGAVAQLLQCIEQVVEELGGVECDEEDDEEQQPLCVAILEGWEEESIEGPSIENPDETYELAVSPLEEDDDGWIYSCDPETGVADMKAGLGLDEDEDDETVFVELDATGWTGLKPVIAALKEATGTGKSPQKGKGVTKLLQQNLTQLCKEGIVLRITVDQSDDTAVNTVCQLLQCIFMVTSDLDEQEEDYGCVAAFLPGWEGKVIEGSSVEDPEEMVQLPVISFEDQGDGDEEVSMESLMEHLGEEGMEALMAKMQGMEIQGPNGGGKSKGKKKK